jgi:hypothetical protein
MADQNSSDEGKAGQVQRGVPELLRDIIGRSRAEIIQTIGTLRGLADALDESVRFEADMDGERIRSFASDIQALGTRALWTAALTISMSERVNVCAQALQIR